jgi:hypothetical protein
MNIPIRSGARLLFRVDPLPGESPRGYLCRVAQEHSYRGPSSLMEIAGLPPSGLDREDRVEQIAHVLRLEPEEWRAMCYRRIRRRDQFDQRSFYGKPISTDDLNYQRPRLCPACLRERPIWWAVWDLGLVAACPIHRCLLVNICPACNRKLAWPRSAVHQCRCGFDFRNFIPETADRDLVAIHAVIHRAAGFPAGEAAERDIAEHGFPPEMLEMKLGSLLRLILFLSSIKEKGGLGQRQRRFGRTDLAAVIEIGRAAVTMLRDWPRPLRDALRSMAPATFDDPAALHFRAIFPNFYRHLFYILPPGEFGFLRDVFERFVAEDWAGFIRSQHRYFSAETHRNSQWVSSGVVQRTARITGQRILDLVRQGQIEGRFFKVGRGDRAECWIRRESLNRWIAAREAELVAYMQRPEARRTLGLAKSAIVSVAAAGVIHHVKGPAQNFPGRCHFFLREDVMQIKHAFEKHAVAVKQYSKPAEIITLRDAVKKYLGRDAGLAAVIRAVVDGSLKPVGNTQRFPGITGYLFRSDDLRNYRPVTGINAPPEGFLNYTEAAAMLELDSPVIRAMVSQGVLSRPPECRSGLSKLVRAAEIQQFAEQYVSSTVLARRMNVNGGLLARYLKESGTPLLAVPIPGKKRGHAYFLLRHVAVRLPLAQIKPNAAHAQTSLQSAEGVGRTRRRPIGFCQ